MMITIIKEMTIIIMIAVSGNHLGLPEGHEGAQGLQALQGRGICVFIYIYIYIYICM